MIRRVEAAGDRRVFAWLIGQADNVGDSVLRREYVRALRGRGPVHAYVGGVSDDFVDGLGLETGDQVYSNFLQWLRAIRRAGWRGSQVTIALNAGEFALSRLFAGMGAGILLVAPSIKRGGGKVLWLGAAVPDGGRRSLLPIFRRLFAISDLVMWRDSKSSSNLAPAPTMPDWAFAAGGERPVPKQRGTIGVSLRFDRPMPSAEWFEAVRALADRLELEPVAVAQVKRDTDRAVAIARILNGRVLPYRTGTHGAQEELLRQEYRGMSLMLSDRLHGLIMAATEGVVPLAWCEQATGKISRHFEIVPLPSVVCERERVIGALNTLDSSGVEQLRHEGGRSLESARRDLHRVAAEVAAL